jgi:hypothetical protein
VTADGRKRMNVIIAVTDLDPAPMLRNRKQAWWLGAVIKWMLMDQLP